MGMLSASASYTRYRITEEVERDRLAEIPDRLRKSAFTDIDDLPEERSFGWVTFEDMLDNAWRGAPPEKGEYFAFALRLDTRRISPAVLKKHHTLALRQEEAAQKEKEGKKGFVSRNRKAEIKEMVRSKLMARALPIPAVFEAVWSTRSHHVYLASTNGKVRDLFEDHFTAAFDLHLEPLTAYTLTLARLGEEAASRLERIEPTVFADLTLY